MGKPIVVNATDRYIHSELTTLGKKIREMKESSSASEVAVQYFVNGSYARDAWRFVELFEILNDNLLKALFENAVEISTGPALLSLPLIDFDGRPARHDRR